MTWLQNSDVSARRSGSVMRWAHAGSRARAAGSNAFEADVESHAQAHLLGGSQANVRHGRVLHRGIRLWPKRPYLTAARLTREPCDRRGPARLGVHAD